MWKMSCNYPFAAIAGQECMKLALLLNAVDPTLSGVLLRGQKGTAKSTAVRALADLLPEQRIVELPVSATEDRLVGTLDLQKALEDHEKAVEPGLLAEADGNILYVDEVNLLADHLVDAVLDAAASGVCTLERDGVRASFPARFALVGSMNPEEGELRPQMLDRFGLSVAVQSEQDPAVRAEVIRRRLAFEKDPEGFCRLWEDEQNALKEQIASARKLLPAVELPDDMVSLAVSLCVEAGAEGHRADIFTCKAATALAAWNGHERVTEEDVREGATYALPHRMADRPFEEAAPAETPEPAQQTRSDAPAQPSREQETVQGMETDIVDVFSSREVRAPKRRDPAGGQLIRTEPARKESITASEFSFPATLRESLRRHRNGDFSIEPSDWQRSIRESRIEHSILFCVDASASIGANCRMAAVKTLVLALLKNAYQSRDEVGLITFRGKAAEVVVPFTRSTSKAGDLLQSVPTGGRTPLAEGLLLAEQELKRHRWKYPEKEPVLVLVTDGRANAGKDARARANDAAEQIAKNGWRVFVFDSEQGPVRLGLAKPLSEVLHAEYYRLDEIVKENES